MKVSVLIPIHRYGGLDMAFMGIENQTFPKDQFELILCDKLYNSRYHIVNDWAVNNNLNIIHFAPSKKTEYHSHSTILNECLNTASGDCCIVAGDYTWFDPVWIERHYFYHTNGWCCAAPQMIYGLPKLKENLKQCYSVFAEQFDLNTFRVLPTFILDPKLQIPQAQIDHRFWYNRNESFPREKGLAIGGWDEGYDNYVGPSNKEFALRLVGETKCRIVNDPINIVRRILSYSIPPFTKFDAVETDDSRNMDKYKELCKKYGLVE